MVGHGRDYSDMQAGIKLDNFINILCSHQFPPRLGRRETPFMKINNVILTSRDNFS